MDSPVASQGREPLSGFTGSQGGQEEEEDDKGEERGGLLSILSILILLSILIQFIFQLILIFYTPQKSVCNKFKEHYYFIEIEYNYPSLTDLTLHPHAPENTPFNYISYLIASYYNIALSPHFLP